MFSGRAWRVVKFSDEAVELHEMSWVEPGAGQVLIRVRTAGAGWPDEFMAADQYALSGELPFGLGLQAAGEVVTAPAGSRFAVG